MSNLDYKEGRGDYFLAEGKREEQRELVYVGPIQHEQGAGVGMCDCWCARCDSAMAVQEMGGEPCPMTRER